MFVVINTETGNRVSNGYPNESEANAYARSYTAYSTQGHGYAVLYSPDYAVKAYKW